jgi:hypothetical protein
MKNEGGSAAIAAVSTAVAMIVLMPFWAARYFLRDRGA